LLEDALTKSGPVDAMTVIYARDLDRMALFYKRTLGIERLEQNEGLVVLGNASFEIAPVKMAGGLPSDGETSGFGLRADTPLKGSYLVASLEQARMAADASCGSLKPIESAWRWRGQLHLDGHDSEDSVVQSRVSAA
jgi:hypothetical protein